MTPLHFVQSAACAKILLERGADMYAQDCIGKTSVSMATLNVATEILCLSGADVDLRDRN